MPYTYDYGYYSYRIVCRQIYPVLNQTQTEYCLTMTCKYSKWESVLIIK